MPDEKPVTEKVKVLAVDSEDKKVVVERGDGDISMLIHCEDGQPITEDAHLVTCSPTDDPHVMEMTTIYGSSKGPSKVNSKAYRDNWNTVFSKSSKKRELPN